MLNIVTAVSQWEREAIGERTRDAMRHKRSNGECVGNIAFGYRELKSLSLRERSWTFPPLLMACRGSRQV